MPCTEKAWGRQILIRDDFWQCWVLSCHGGLVTLFSRWQPKCKRLWAAIQIISLKSCSVAHWELVLSSPREHCMEPNTTAPGAMLFCINSGWSSIPSSGNSSFSLSRHSQPQSSGLTTRGLTFCPGYKIRHGIKHSCKYPRVRETRLQTQHSSKEKTCNADVMNPATWPGPFLSAKR